MPQLAIHADSLGKKYRIGTQIWPSGLYDIVARIIHTPLSSIKELAGQRKKKSEEPNTIWAVQGVSFDIHEGEIVGIIGSNGAGKSTLLKLLSRITEPTIGYALVRGRVASLLEVGIGFHPELTGRENIYMNGVILGMTQTEISRKFSEIVEFSGTGKFIDTPMKHYSSGMYVRLAFAVAAHLEPDILIVDEVLAVGDVAFQNKCLGKLEDVAREGRTILFVSHNLSAVVNLCQRAILLDHGRVIADGAPKDVISTYLETVEASTEILIGDRTDRQGNQSLKFISAQLLDSNTNPVGQLLSGEDATIALRYQSKENHTLKNVHVKMIVYGKFHETLFELSTDVCGLDWKELPPQGQIRLTIPRLPLQPGRYSIDLHSSVGGNEADHIQHAASISVEPGDFFGTGRLPQPNNGPFLVPHSWIVEHNSL